MVYGVAHGKLNGFCSVQEGAVDKRQGRSVGDGEGANVSRNKLLAWQAHPTVSGGQPNPSRLESWSSIHRMSA